jgi:hypothetical protein
MILWRKARTEVAGAWRSVRYDLGRPEPDAHAPAGRPGLVGPDVTSTGFSTFGGAGLTGGLRTSYGEQLVPRPRRLAAVSAFGVLAVAGAAGSYFAVVNGVGALIGDKPAGAEPYPLAAEAPRGTEAELSNSGLGRGTADRTGQAPAAAGAPAQPAAGTIRVLPTTTVAAPAPPEVTVPRPRQTGGAGKPETRPTTCCLNPPVPTPTAPVPTPHSPSATPSPAASSPDGSDAPEPSGSAAPATPDDQDGTSGTDEDENHSRDSRRH